MADSNIQAIYPLTPMQEGVLFHILESPQTGTYFNQYTCRLIGPLDEERFENAWRAAYSKHTALRTLFTWEKRDRPLQIVRRRVDLPYRVLDWRDKDCASAERDLETFLDSDRDTGFDLGVAPLSRIALIRLDDELAQMVWSFHHILLDGWSVRRVLDEVMSCYRSAASRFHAMEPTPSFEDFVSWRNNRDYASGKAFWQQQLDGVMAPTTLEMRLQADDSGAGPGHPGMQTSFEIDQPLCTRLRAFAREQRVTLSTVFVAAWSILLARYCDSRDVVFGTTVAGRSGDLEGIDRVVGLLINTLPMRVGLGKELTVTELLQNVQVQHVRQQPFEQMSLQDIRNCSQVPPPAPLFETIVVFENAPGGPGHESAMPKVTGERFIEHSNFPLALLVVPGPTIEMITVYDGRRYSLRAAEQLLRGLDAVLRQLVDKPRARVDEISALPPGEQQRLLQAGSGASFAPGDRHQSVVQLFERAVAATPHAVALTNGTDRETYDSLNRKANRLARFLLDRHQARGRPVIIHASRSIDAIVAMLASLKCGAVYTPTDVNESGSRLRQVATDLARHFESPAAVRPLVLTQREFIDDMPADIADVELIRAAQSGGDDSNLDHCAEGSDLAYVIYTSGSTGEPKGVMVQHSALLNSNLARFEFYNEQPGSFALVSSLATDSSLAGIYWTLCAGGKLMITPPRTELDIEQLTALLQMEGVTHLLCVPSLYALILENADIARLESLRVVIVAGEASNESLVKRHAALLPIARLYNEYGPSEACVWATASELGADVVSIGRPIANVRAYVLDSGKRLVPSGVAGELYIGGANLALGYLGRPEATAAAFVGDPFVGNGSRMYRTGDRVRAWEDGRLEFLGRSDRQIKIRGFRVEPGEIEAVLSARPDIDEAVVYKHSFPSGEQLVAVVTGRATAAEGLRAYCERNLPGHMVPQQFARMDALPRTPAGKTDYEAIKHTAPFDTSLSTNQGNAGAEPRTPLEEKLAAIWREVMGLDKVYVFDNFFEIGGDSLMTIRILSRAVREGIKIRPEQFFENPTIAGQAAIAVTAGRNTETGAVAAGPAPLLPIQHWFFSNILTDPHHWNQSYLLEVDPAVTQPEIERAIATLVQRHDALRTQFTKTGMTWSAEVSDVAAVPIESVALGSDSPGSRNQHVQEIASQLNSSFDLGRAPLVRACHFVSESDARNLLLLVIHHLVIDVESWRILLAELEILLAQRGGKPQSELAHPGTSTARWASVLQELANSAELNADKAYWDRLLQAGPVRLPTESDRPIGTNREEDTVTRSFTLPADRLASLSASAHESLRASPYEVITSAVARAIANWGGFERVVFDTEGHGRESLAGSDAAAAVGWLTSVYPLVFDADEATWSDATAALRHVKERLRSTPKKGVTFGILRYLTPAGDRPAAVAAYDGADILFNYLGETSIGSKDDAILSLVDARCGKARSSHCERAYLVEINAYQSMGALVFDVSYSTELFSTETVDAFGERLLLAIHEIADTAGDQDQNATIAADFPLADLSTEDLDSIASQLGALDD